MKKGILCCLLFIVTMSFDARAAITIVSLTPSTSGCGVTNILGDIDCNFDGEITIGVEGGIPLGVTIESPVTVIAGDFDFDITLTSQAPENFNIIISVDIVTNDPGTCVTLGDFTTYGYTSTCMCTAPEIDPISDVTVCVSYELPTITGTNLTDNEAYYDGSGGTGTMYSVGDMLITSGTYYAYDGVSGCDDEESFIVTVGDTEVPTAACQDITVSLDANGNVSITGADVDGGSTDNCDDDLSLSVSPNSFNCDDVGNVAVTLTVIDDANLSSTCMAMVTIEDNIPPTATCQDLTIQLDANGNASIIAENINNGSFDNCGNVTLSIDITDFDCADIGDIHVTLTVTDDAGNESACLSHVDVQDTQAPLAMCQDITVTLDANGSATILVSDLDNGSTDNCGGNLSLSASQTSFDCADVGEVGVTLTVSDSEGNAATCSATVTVEDAEAPTITCPEDITLCELEVEDLGDATADDNCAGTTISNNAPGTFPVGNTIVTWTATDASSNETTCEQQVTITEAEEPTFDITTSYCNDEDAVALPIVSLENILGNWSGPGVMNNMFDPAEVGAGSWEIIFTPDLGQCATEITLTIEVEQCDCDNQPVVIAGPNQEICAHEDVDLFGNIIGAGIDHWESSGDGIFTNETALETIYIPGNGDIQNGMVSLTLISTDPDGPDEPCIPASDEMLVTIYAYPVLDEIEDISSCGSYTLTEILGQNLENPVYRTAANGGGAILMVGTLITESQTIYIWDDRNGCTDQQTFEITIFPGAQAEIVVNQHETCEDDCEGSATASGAATYLWSDGQTTATAIGLCAGDYEVTVTDDNGCTNTESVTIEEGENYPEASANNTGAYCEGDMILLEGSGEGSVSWSGPNGFISEELNANIPNASVLNEGLYQLIITSEGGCADTAITEVEVFANPVSSLAETAAICAGQSVSLYAGEASMYAWSTNETTSTIEVEEAGVYSVTLTTGMCSTVDSAEVIVSDSLQPEISGELILCDSTSITLLEVIGDFDSYLWTTGDTTSSIEVDSVGVYNVMVSKGDCNGSASVTVVRNSSIEVYATVMDVLCFGDCNGAVFIDSIGGGIVPYSIMWNTGDTVLSLEDLCPGDYSVTVMDANGCTLDLSLSVGEPDYLSVVYESVDSFTVSGGTGPLDTIFDGITNADIVTITDANGCMASDTIFVVGTNNTASEALAVHVYPSPTRDMIYIEYPEDLDFQDLQIRLIDIYGRVMTLEGTPRILSLRDMTPGIYHLLLTSDTRSQSIKIILTQ